MVVRHSSLISVLSILLASACQLGFLPSPITVPSIPIDELNAAPERVEIGGRTFQLQAHLRRDFMPMTPPDGRPMTAFVQVTAVDSSDVRPGVSPDYLWVINGEDIWAAPLTDLVPAERPDELQSHAVGGPKWGPGILVDVVVGLTDPDGKLYLVRQPDVPIERTE